ncbi:MAG: hypothetical protein D6753_13880 [Planctomycetota bacterium]|nr:MAG: hypothetical protein D6753_13880 [Planctomycetota bacterium]
MSKSLNRAFIKAYNKDHAGQARDSESAGDTRIRQDGASAEIPAPHLGDSRRGSLESVLATGTDGVLDAAAMVAPGGKDAGDNQTDVEQVAIDDAVHAPASPLLVWNEAFATQVVAMVAGELEPNSNQSPVAAAAGPAEEPSARSDARRQQSAPGNAPGRMRGELPAASRASSSGTHRTPRDVSPGLDAPAGPALSPESYRAAMEKLARRHEAQGKILRVDASSPSGDAATGREPQATTAGPSPSQLQTPDGAAQQDIARHDAPQQMEGRQEHVPGAAGVKAEVLQVEEHLRKMKGRVFNPAWEVDSIPWPEVCTRLLRDHYETMDIVGRNLRQSCQDGLQVLGVTAPRSGMGTSTVACCLAMLAGVYGLKVALVDADLESPTLAEQANLEIEIDWKTALLQDMSVEDAAVHSIDDQVTLVPLLAAVPPAELDVFDPRIVRMFQQLTDSFDLVIVDVGSMESDRSLMTSLGRQGMINAVATVVDRRAAEAPRIEACIRRLRRCGIQSIGLVENFAA